MTIHSSKPRRQGFTLIELLVVIAIIAILAALGFGAGATAINNARKVTAKNDCTNLVLAITAYYDDYSHYPDVGGGGAGDTEAPTDAQLMNILMGLGSQGEAKNPKKTKFFTAKEAKGANGREYGGLLREANSAELFDPWRKTQAGAIRYYWVSWDGNYDDEVGSPFSAKVLYQPVIAWSTGKDGKETRGSESDSKNRDNVYSWR